MYAFINFTYFLSWEKAFDRNRMGNKLQVKLMFCSELRSQDFKDVTLQWNVRRIKETKRRTSKECWYTQGLRTVGLLVQREIKLLEPRELKLLKSVHFAEAIILEKCSLFHNHRCKATKEQGKILYFCFLLPLNLLLLFLSNGTWPEV